MQLAQTPRRHYYPAPLPPLQSLRVDGASFYPHLHRRTRREAKKNDSHTNLPKYQKF